MAMNETVIREPPELFSTERDRIELVTGWGAPQSPCCSLLIKRTRSVRFVPLLRKTAAIDSAIDVGGSPSFAILGSEIGGGRFREFQTDVVKGFFATNLQTTAASVSNESSTKHLNQHGDNPKDLSVGITPPVSTIFTVIRGIKDDSSPKRNNDWTIGRFDWSNGLTPIPTYQSSDLDVSNKTSTPLHGTKRRRAESNRESPSGTKPQSTPSDQGVVNAYRLRQRYRVSSGTLEWMCFCSCFLFQLGSETSVISFCPLFPSTWSSSQSTDPDVLATLIHCSSNSSQSLQLQIISTTSLSTISQIDLPLSPVPCLVSWKVIQIHDSSHQNAVAVCGLSQDNGGAQNATLVIAIISLSSEGIPVQFYGWQTFSPPLGTTTTSRPHLVNVLPLPSSAVRCRSRLQPNLITIWSNGMYQLLNATTKCLVVRTYSIQCPLLDSFWILPLTSDLIVEDQWSKDKGKK